VADASRTLLLGVTGSVAAFRAIELASALTQENWRVLTIMTEAAREFIQPLSFACVTREPVLTYVDPPQPLGNLDHTTVTRDASVLAIVPASAQTIAKLAHGFADNFLTLAALAFRGPVLLAPGMNCRMYESAPVQENIATLRRRGYEFIGPVEGRMACGETGMGRLAPVNDILAAIRALVARERP
jgi:phosphopantothenoylcysteine synthetase/decarboxylase